MNLDLHHRFINNDHKETVMLLHGFMSDHTGMKGIGETLAHAFNLLYVDLPGFGASKSTVLAYDMNTVADSLKTILDELDIETVHVLGYSMGGRTALAFGVLYPERTQSLILESASPGLKTAGEKEKRALIDEERAQKITEDYQHFLDEWERMGLFQTQKNLPGDAFLEQRRMRESQQPEEVSDSLRKYGTGVQPSYWNRLPDLEMPVLLVAGKKDEKFVSINEEMQKQVTHASLEIVEGAGHNIHLESKEKFGTIITEFLT